jgi:hypothetical protein
LTMKLLTPEESGGGRRYAPAPAVHLRDISGQREIKHSDEELVPPVLLERSWAARALHGLVSIHGH